MLAINDRAFSLKYTVVRIFVSHINGEAPIAVLLKRFIEQTLPGVSVFVSSDVRDLTPGNRWLNSIEAALREADLVIVICSRASLSRPWINFETGCAWINGLKIVPVCHSGQRLHQLPYPFSELQALQLEDENFPSLIIQTLCHHAKIGWTPSIDVNRTRADIREAKTKIYISDASPQIIHSPVERTKLINDDLRLLLRSPGVADETIWTSAFLSTFAIGREESRIDIVEESEREVYRELLLEERDLLLSLARSGCTVRCIISPASRNHVRHIGIRHAIQRTKTLLEFLRSDERIALEHIEWAASELGTKNLYIIGRISCFEGYKRGIQHGYGLTLRQTDHDVISANTDLYRRLFRDLAARTLARWSSRDDDSPGECELLRIAIQRCLEESLQYLSSIVDTDSRAAGR
jgi:hypothetical protein